MNRAPDADGWVSLNDAQWTNIVNHDHAYQSMSKDDAVHLAVKMTEDKCRELNIDAKALAKLRDEFAGKALAAMIAQPDKDGANRGARGVPLLCTFAYEYAEAMLAERAK